MTSPANNSRGISAPGASAESTFKRWLRGRMDAADLGMLPVIAALIVIWIVLGLLNPNFLTARNISNLSTQIVVTGTLALAQIYVILLGMIDLSIGWNAVVAASVYGVATVFLGLPIWVALLLAVAVSTAIGLTQGLFVSRIGAPSFIVSLGGAMIAQGIVLELLTPHGGSIGLSDHFSTLVGTVNIPPLWGWITSMALFTIYALVTLRRHGERAASGGEAGLGSRAGLAVLLVSVIAYVATVNAYRGIPVLLVIFLAVLFGSAFVTKATQFGRHLYAVGGNAEAARRAGINVRFIQLSVFVISGFLVALAGLLDGARLGVASASVGSGDLMLNAVAAAVIGGTSLFGGRGSVYGALFGALVIESVANGMDLLGAPSSIRFGVSGAILLAAITVDTLLRQKRLRTGRG